MLTQEQIKKIDTEILRLQDRRKVSKFGTEDFIETVTALKYLTDNIPREILAKSDNSYIMQTNSVYANITAGETGNLDFKIENYVGESYFAKFIKGGRIFCKNAEFGDWIEVDIIDKDGILGYGENLLLKKYCYKMFIKPDSINLLDCPFAPGRIPCGFWVRIKYHSVGSQNVDVYLTLQIFSNDNEWFNEEESSSSGS